MLAPQALIRGIVSRVLPQPNADSPSVDVSSRFGRYGENAVLSYIRKQHLLADEGSYFVANNSGTGVASVATPTAFSDTAPLFTIYNSDVVTNAAYKRIYMDWLRLTQTAAGTAGVDLRLRLVLDATVPSAGTVLTPVCPNMDSAARAIAVPRILPTGVTQTANSRVVVGTLQAIPTLSAPLTVLDEVFLNFGPVETNYPNFSLAASTNVVKMGWPVPPVILGPGQALIVEFLITSQSAASSWTAEAAWWER